VRTSSRWRGRARLTLWCLILCVCGCLPVCGALSHSRGLHCGHALTCAAHGGGSSLAGVTVTRSLLKTAALLCGVRVARGAHAHPLWSSTRSHCVTHADRPSARYAAVRVTGRACARHGSCSSAAAHALGCRRSVDNKIGHHLAHQVCVVMAAAWGVEQQRRDRATACERTARTPQQRPRATHTLERARLTHTEAPAHPLAAQS
jgi:hypothetical protein